MTKPETIDLTPTWSGILPALLALLENGTETGKLTARQELANMARAADRAVELAKAPAADKAPAAVGQIGYMEK